MQKNRIRVIKLTRNFYDIKKITLTRKLTVIFFFFYKILIKINNKKVIQKLSRKMNY